MKVKICGLTRACDIDFVNEARPDFCGFVFAPGRRQVTVAQAQALREKLAEGILPIGVFVNEPVQNVAWLLENEIVRWPQLHGAEDENYIADLRARTDGKFPVIRALKVESAADILAAQSSSADYLLLDHGAGGTGKTFNWDFLRDFWTACAPESQESHDVNQIEHQNSNQFQMNFNSNSVSKDRSKSPRLFESLKPFFLAGGLNLENVEEAKSLGAFALDLSSGAETHGVKDRDKILELVRRIHK